MVTIVTIEWEGAQLEVRARYWYTRGNRTGHPDTWTPPDGELSIENASELPPQIIYNARFLREVENAVLASIDNP